MSMLKNLRAAILLIPLPSAPAGWNRTIPQFFCVSRPRAAMFLQGVPTAPLCYCISKYTAVRTVFLPLFQNLLPGDRLRVDGSNAGSETAFLQVVPRQALQRSLNLYTVRHIWLIKMKLPSGSRSRSGSGWCSLSMSNAAWPARVNKKRTPVGVFCQVMVPTGKESGD